jgi:hypothetical protein
MAITVFGAGNSDEYASGIIEKGGGRRRTAAT